MKNKLFRYRNLSMFLIAFMTFLSSLGVLALLTSTVKMNNMVVIGNMPTYVINHHQMNLDGTSYNLESKETKTAKMFNETVTLANFKKTYEHFTYENSKVNGTVSTTANIRSDSSTVIDLYYSRNQYNLDLNGKHDDVLTNTNLWGTFDVYINGNIVSDNVHDFDKKYPYGTTYEIKNVKPYAGRQYNGVYTNETYKNGLSGTVGDNLFNKKTVIYLDFSTVQYDITYNLNGGTILKDNPSSYNVDTDTITLSNPTKTGYTFNGWYTESSFINKITSIAKGSTGNKTLYAKWTANTNTAYKVIHQQMNLDGVNYTTVETENLTGTTDANITPSVKTYKGFTSPSTQTTTILADGSREITYKYERNKYYLDLNAELDGIRYKNFNDGTGDFATVDIYINNELAMNDNHDYYNEHYYGTLYEINDIKTKDGFRYDGIIEGTLKGEIGVNVKDHTFVIFKFSTIQYDITYNLNGGTLSENNPSTYNVRTDTITLNNPIKTGYIFDGWYTESSFTNKITSIAKGSTGNKTLYAKWKTEWEEVGFRGVDNYSTTFDMGADGLIKNKNNTGNWSTSNLLTTYFAVMKDKQYKVVVTCDKGTFYGYTSGNISLFTTQTIQEGSWTYEGTTAIFEFTATDNSTAINIGDTGFYYRVDSPLSPNEIIGSVKVYVK